MNNENYVAPKAQPEFQSTESLELGEQKPRSESKASLGNTKTGAAVNNKEVEDPNLAVKFVKNMDEASIEIGNNVETSFSGMGKEELLKYANDPFWKKIRWSLFILFWLAWLGMLVGAIVIVVMAPKCPAPLPLEYYQKGVVYSVNAKSFQDSDNNGYGDLKGITGRLDHFVHLGIDMLAISPVFKMQSEGYGYDVIDFIDINPLLGTLQDFKDLTTAAKSKNLKILLDFIPNHTGKQHPWFQQSSTGTNANYSDYYVWHNGNNAPNNWASVFGGTAWTFDPVKGQNYYHKYGSEQPDLNMRSERVQQEMEDILAFWLDQGVSGFRLFSVPYLFEAMDLSINDTPDEARTKNLDETYAYVGELRSILQRYEDADGEHRVLLVEAENSPIDSVVKYYGSSAEPIADLPVNGQLIKELTEGFSSTDLRKTVEDYLTKVRVVEGAWPTWVLGNYDTSRVASRLGGQLVDALSMVQILLPGTPIVYYGEEISMDDVLISGGTPALCSMSSLTPTYSCNQARSPFQWDMSSNNAGFTNATAPWHPVGNNLQDINAKTQMGLSESHLNLYRNLVELRKQPAIMHGDIYFPENDITDVFYFTRIRKGSPGYLIMCNLGKGDLIVDLSTDASLPTEAQAVLRSVGSNSTMTAKGSRILTKEIPIKSFEGLVLSFVPKF